MSNSKKDLLVISFSFLFTISQKFQKYLHSRLVFIYQFLKSHLLVIIISFRRSRVNPRILLLRSSIRSSLSSQNSSMSRGILHSFKHEQNLLLTGQILTYLKIWACLKRPIVPGLSGSASLRFSPFNCLLEGFSWVEKTGAGEGGRPAEASLAVHYNFLVFFQCSVDYFLHQSHKFLWSFRDPLIDNGIVICLYAFFPFWKVYAIILEYCSDGDFDTMIGDI